MSENFPKSPKTSQNVPKRPKTSKNVLKGPKTPHFIVYQFGANQYPTYLYYVKSEKSLDCKIIKTKIMIKCGLSVEKI